METITAKKELLQRSSCTSKRGASNYFREGTILILLYQVALVHSEQILYRLEKVADFVN